MIVPVAPPEVLYPPWWVTLVWVWSLTAIAWITYWLYWRTK